MICRTFGGRQRYALLRHFPDDDGSFSALSSVCMTGQSRYERRFSRLICVLNSNRKVSEEGLHAFSTLDWMLRGHTIRRVSSEPHSGSVESCTYYTTSSCSFPPFSCLFRLFSRLPIVWCTRAGRCVGWFWNMANSSARDYFIEKLVEPIAVGDLLVGQFCRTHSEAPVTLADLSVSTISCSG